MKLFATWIMVITFFIAGCKSIGPKKMTRDRFDYSHALADSWKKQMLLNIVKVRYLDLPIFLDVGQLVTGYSMETSVNLGGSMSSANNFGSFGAQGRYTDRPTITYMPLTGERFLEGFLIPVKPINVFSLIQSGYEADFILELCLDSFNGLFNRSVSLASKRQPNEAFFEVIILMREIQDAGAIGMKIVQSEDEQQTIVFFFRNQNVSEEIQQKSAEVRRLLEVPDHQMEFKLVYSPMKGGPGELGIGTRSMWQILTAMAMGIVIPDSHRERRLIPPLTEIGIEETPLLRVLSGQSKPEDYYVAVPYEDEWFWIANDDWKSKNTFGSILFLFSLADSRASENLPTITIPTY